MSGTNESPNYVEGSLRRVWRNAGAPVDGGSGTYVSVCDAGDLLIDTTNKKLYINTNTQASPTWSQVPTGGVTMAEGVEFASAGLTFSGTPTKIISAGSYASPLTHQNSELITVAASDTTGWVLGIGSYMKVTGEDGYPFAFCGLVESTDTTGTKTLQGAQFMAFLGTVGGSQAAHLKTASGDTTAGMYACWLKVGSNSNCVFDSGSKLAALWLDNSISGTVSGEHYSAYITAGGVQPDAAFGMESGTNGWASLFYFDETCYNKDPILSTGTCKVDATKDSTGTIKINLNGTTYYIGYWAVADLTS